MPHNVSFGRIVYTYLNDAGLPLGAVTGYEKDKCFFIEHVMVFPYAPQSTLLRMMSQGMDRLFMSDIGFRSVAVHWKKDHPFASGLEALALRFGFTRYNEADAECLHMARWR